MSREPRRVTPPVTCSFCGRTELTRTTTLLKGDRPGAVICASCATRFARLLAMPGEVIAHDQDDSEEVTVG